ncbi:MAG: hypothetical protein OSJ62_07470 [Lachnospiraceae bacterium]|nr:hypothetical protein [Lachnospiraceae bacterium]
MTQLRKRLGLSVPENLYKNILKKAEYQGKTINSTCIDIFWEYFEKQGRGYNDS